MDIPIYPSPAYIEDWQSEGIPHFLVKGSSYQE